MRAGADDLSQSEGALLQKSIKYQRESNQQGYDRSVRVEKTDRVLKRP